MDILTTLLNNLLFDDNFALIPYNSNASKQQKFAFNFFINMDIKVLVKKLLVYETTKTNKYRALGVIIHHKGYVDFNITNITYENFMILKDFCSDRIIEQYIIIFYENIFIDLQSEILTIEPKKFIQIVKHHNINHTIKIAKQYKLDIINDLFKIDNELVFNWINGHPNPYNELKKLNQPMFILNNIQHKLNINENTLKYFFEICPIDLNVYKDLRNTLGLETIWKYQHNKLSIEFLMALTTTLDDINFIISLDNIPLSTLNSYLEKIKNDFPHIYYNLNSLLVVKKSFS